MRVQNINIKIQIHIPTDKPDLNGVIYNKDAILKAFNKPLNGLPIIYRDNDSYDVHVIGKIDDSNYVLDEKTQEIIVSLSGAVTYGGADIIVNKMSIADEMPRVEEYTITSIGFSQ